MKTIGMIFNTEMVQALLSGNKTVTRRPLSETTLTVLNNAIYAGEILSILADKSKNYVLDFAPVKVGDEIYVRETWGVVSHDYDEFDNIIGWTPDRPSMIIKDMKFGQGYYSGNIIYRSDGGFTWRDDYGDEISAWKPSIHMPKKLSRITLKVTDVRIETINQLRKNPEQVKREGFKSFPQFKHVWQSIYGSCKPSEYVWVIEFEVIKPTMKTDK
ncbi:ASCH domain-containing protein [Aliivibrio fischeri]|uniref:ASCH domain-containing protein n=1 Tax=Aliivibrio fischeri TaxID=668 RepID=UPI0012DA88E8|nr:ASCH domain-containing protein [Aliivibrio fischeri]MUK94768.1 ASCH domain-containing protein [Aliivibrio fischeri]